MSKLDKRLPKNATKFGDHLSIISVGNDVWRFFLFLALVAPKRGLIKLMWANLIKDYPIMLQTKFGDHPSIRSVEIDI
jgi:hypothetical protein